MNDQLSARNPAPVPHWAGAQPVRQKSARLTVTLADAISALIKSGKLQPGDKLPTESGLMLIFEVSRSVVRETLAKLQMSGLVVTRQGIGTFVTSSAASAPEPAAGQAAPICEIAAAFELRLGLETEAAGLAAIRRTAEDITAIRAAMSHFRQSLQSPAGLEAKEFECHLQIACAAHSQHFSAVLRTLDPHGSLAETSADQCRLLSSAKDSLHELESVLGMIVLQDADAARAAMRTHLGNKLERRRRMEASARPA